jgi:hypothetical protein
VCSIWLRHDLSSFKKRLKAREEIVAKEGIILAEAQVAALGKKQHDYEAAGGIEMAHPGYLGSHDTLLCRKRSINPIYFYHSACFIVRFSLMGKHDDGIRKSHLLATAF